MSEKIVSVEAGDDFLAAAKIAASPSWPPLCEICNKNKGGHMIHRDSFGFFRYSITFFHCDDCQEQSKSYSRMLCAKRGEEKKAEAIAQLRSGDKNYLKYFQVKLHNKVSSYTDEDGKNWLAEWVNDNLPDMADQILNFPCEVCQQQAQAPILSWDDQNYHIYCYKCCPPNTQQFIF
jgi:hypothetical protein